MPHELTIVRVCVRERDRQRRRKTLVRLCPHPTLVPLTKIRKKADAVVPIGFLCG